MLTIETATHNDVAELERRISASDAAELAAAGYSVPESVDGVPAQALAFGGELVCLFGVVSHPSSPRGGIPWMLCTTTLERVPRRAMAAISRHVVAGWRDSFDTLTNLIHRRNAAAIRFVEWLGFTVHREPNGPGQEFFVFEWSRHV